MAILIATDFEDYADGTLPVGVPPWPQSPYQDSLLDAGWIPGVLANTWPATRVVSDAAHSGSKSVRMGSEAEDGQFDEGGLSTLSRTISDATVLTITIEAWFKRLDVNNVIGTPPSGTLYKAGPSIFLMGSDHDVANALFIHNPHLTNTLIFGNFGTTLATVPDVLVDDVWQKIRAELRLSTVNLAVSPADLNLDGRARVWVDDVLVVDLSAISLGASNVGWPTGLNGYTLVYFTINGWMDGLTVTDGLTTPPGNPGDPLPNTPPCCHSDCCGGDGGGGGGDTPGTQPPGHPGPILPPVGSGWTPGCTGGGTVTTAADVVDAESWVM